MFIMTKYRLINIFLPLVLANFSYAEPVAGSNPDGYAIKEIPLAVTYKKVDAKVLISDSIINSAVAREFAVFASHRKVWILSKTGKIYFINPQRFLPHRFDWFDSICNAGDRIVISVSRYPEEQQQKESNKPMDSVHAGAKPAGLVIVSGKGVSFIEKFNVVYVGNVLRKVGKDQFSQLPSQTIPSIQSCFWNGKSLLIGSLGLEAVLDIKKRRAEVLDYDSNRGFNRISIAQIGGSRWVALGRGGNFGGCVSEITNNKKKFHCLEGFSTPDLQPDKIVGFNQRVFISSLAGVVEILNSQKLYKQYQITSDPSTMGVYELKAINNEIWGNRDDGWVKFDLNNREATVYQFADQDTSNVIYELNYFNNKWYVSNKDALFEITTSLN